MNVFLRSQQIFEELFNELESLSLLDAGVRSDLSYQCCGIALQHSIAFKVLLEQQLDNSALVILRTQFEAVVRAYWILLCASPKKILELKNQSIEDLLKN